MNKFITEKGRITNCPANVAKMNVLKYCRHILGIRKTFFPVIAPNFRELLREFVQLLFWVIQICPIFWVLSLIIANEEIKRAKFFVTRHENNNNE